MKIEERDCNPEQSEIRTEANDKTWTIRRVSSDTIDLVKEAADAEGMKIGAWVDNQLKKAAASSLGGGRSVLAEEISDLSRQANIELIKQQSERLETLESGLVKVIQGQHSLFTLFSRLSGADDGVTKSRV